MVERGFAFRADEENGGRVGVYPVGSPDEGGASNPPMDAAAIGPPPGPSFDKTLPRNVTIQAGKMAILSCRVFNINDKSVSWGSTFSCFWLLQQYVFVYGCFLFLFLFFSF